MRMNRKEKCEEILTLRPSWNNNNSNNDDNNNREKDILCTNVVGTINDDFGHWGDDNDEDDDGARS